MIRPLADRVRALPAPDRAVIGVLIGAALVALTGGAISGGLTALARGGLISLDPDVGYRLLTVHGVTVFFYWLYFAQAALLLLILGADPDGSGRIAARPLAILGCCLMLLGFGASESAALWGEPMLYDAAPGLAADAGWLPGFYYLGYLLLAGGLALVAIAAIATTFAGQASGEWSSVTFSAVAWAGLLLVTSIASVIAFWPALRWILGWGEFPSDYEIGWHVLFHNLHYLPLMATVVTWYVLVQDLCGIKSVFGQRFSKIVFSLYLLFVPPTSLYHMFLDPGLDPGVRAVGSVLSLLIGIPTILMFLVIVVSLEAHARAAGARGLFGWLAHLPWRQPAMSAIGMATVNLALGGTFAFVLIQERLAPLLSDTLFVPAYFHFLTLGTVTLTFLGAFTVLLPGLMGVRLLASRSLAALPVVLTVALVVFGVAGLVAGYLGAPRRVVDIGYDGAAPALWSVLLPIMGAAGTLMAVTVLTYVAALVASWLRGAPAVPVIPPALAAGSAAGPAWTGPVAVAVLLAAMFGTTWLSFVLLRALPVI